MTITIQNSTLFALLSLTFLFSGCGSFTCEDLVKSYELEDKIAESVKSKDKKQALKFHKESNALIKKIPTTGDTLTCTVKGHEKTYELTPTYKSTREEISKTFKMAVDRL